jgi:predicted transcriptional regulator
MAGSKVTFSLDDATCARLERIAGRLAIPKSQVVREAIREYEVHVDRLDEQERRRMLAVFDDVIGGIPARPQAEVARELAELRASRRAGGRAQS